MHLNKIPSATDVTLPPAQTSKLLRLLVIQLVIVWKFAVTNNGLRSQGSRANVVQLSES